MICDQDYYPVPATKPRAIQYTLNTGETVVLRNVWNAITNQQGDTWYQFINKGGRLISIPASLCTEVIQ